MGLSPKEINIPEIVLAKIFPLRYIVLGLFIRYLDVRVAITTP